MLFLKKAFQLFTVKWSSLWLFHQNILKSASKHNIESTRKLRTIWGLFLKKTPNVWKPLIPLQNVTSIHPAASPRTYEFVQIQNTILKPNSDLHLPFKNRPLIPTLSYSVFNFQAPLHFLVSGLTGNGSTKIPWKWLCLWWGWSGRRNGNISEVLSEPGPEKICSPISKWTGFR